MGVYQHWSTVGIVCTCISSGRDGSVVITSVVRDSKDVYMFEHLPQDIDRKKDESTLPEDASTSIWLIMTLLFSRTCNILLQSNCTVQN